jgi:hypothetical protein
MDVKLCECGQRITVYDLMHRQEKCSACRYKDAMLPGYTARLNYKPPVKPENCLKGV